MKFTPSPTKKVIIVDKEGQPVKTVLMNRAQRRKLRIKNKGANRARGD